MNPKARLCLLTSVLALMLPTAPAHALPVGISEVFYDAVGADTGQVFVELYGCAGLSLDGYRIEGVNGSGGGVGPVLALVGSIPTDGFFVVADLDGMSTSVPNADLLLDFDFQNGPDSIVLRAPDDAIVDAIGYGSFGAGDVFAGEGTAAPDPPAGSSLARLLANVDTDDNAADFVVLDTPTPGTGAVLDEPEPAVLFALALVCLGGMGRFRSARDPAPSTVR